MVWFMTKLLTDSFGKKILQRWIVVFSCVCLVFMVAGCQISNVRGEFTRPIVSEPNTNPNPEPQPEPRPQPTNTQSSNLVEKVRTQAADLNISALEPPESLRNRRGGDDLVELGKLLAFDKILSGNQDISCMTCHQPSLGTGDDRQLSIGQGASGLGEQRVHPENEFIPRNAPPLFNLHVLDDLFWDGRVSMTTLENGKDVYTTPAAEQLNAEMKDVFEFGAVSSLALFPVTSRIEMRGDGTENELSVLADDDFQGIWQALMERLGNNREYVRLFEKAYPRTDFKDMTFAHASNAIAAFFVQDLAATNSPWDRFLRGDDSALTAIELDDANTFLSAPCTQCHSGSGLSDGEGHNVVVIQFGPGSGHGPEGNDDFGLMGITNNPDDIYKFRTPPLRNVTLTGPWGHTGQFTELVDYIDHYSENADKIRNYDSSQVEPLLRDQILFSTVEDIIATRDPIIENASFDDETVLAITNFLATLTDPKSENLAVITPRSVPSGLSVDGARPNGREGVD